MQGLYSRLAISGIKKNYKLYFPYLLSVIGMVAIYYILTYLTKSPALNVMGGGSNMRVIMMLGKIVMIIFSFLFLFYTNSFLAKKRNKEFALYNILGMNKKNVVRIIGGENIICGLVSIMTGLLAGILLSKLFEICLLKLCSYTPDYAVYFSWECVVETAIWFAVIFVVLFCFSSFNVAINKPIELLRSYSRGEKEPKANWIIGLAGIGILVAAYYMAVSIDNPLQAINYFVVAVIMVIVATYLLFIFGSVLICRVLKHNKNYYYNPKHYVAISGMMYRMKRNGAGLATICILCTMVLVMITSAGSLYFGSNDSIDNMYPKDIHVTVSEKSSNYISEDYIQDFENRISPYIGSITKNEEKKVRYVSLVGIISENEVVVDNVVSTSAFQEGNNAALLAVYSLEEYNKYGNPVELGEGEALLCVVGKKYNYEDVKIRDHNYKIAGKTDERLSGAVVDIATYYNLVIKDFDDFVKEIDELDDDNISAYFVYEHSFNDNLTKEENMSLEQDLLNVCNASESAVSKDDYKTVFLELYGSLFLLGIFLSVAFIGATVLIIYYKQITEGYEDANGYSIMRKVGMTKEEIKKGVDSQTLITFFSPLLLAGFHLAFSFPMIEKILLVFGITNTLLLILVYAGCFVIFSLLYLFVYKKTVKSYIEIVSF